MKRYHKIAFIICINDEYEFAECRYYIEHLKIPNGYKIDILTIEDASSMTAGYNAGLQSTDAKYKVYLHQDVFIINPNFITDMLAVFLKQKKTGDICICRNLRCWQR
jgi:hypothetical protein